MARINSNIASLIAQTNLSRTQDDLQVRLERLSTGLRINHGKDDPAGVIISERLRSNIAGVESGIQNSQRASSMMSTTESALAEISDLLNSVRGLLVQSANTAAISDEERDANQLQIDSAIDSITRISNTASFGSLKVLDGSLDYTVSGVSGSIAQAQVNAASLVNRTNLQVSVDVVASAQVGSLFYNGGAGNPPGVLASSMTLEVMGKSGVQTISLTSSMSLTNVAAAINQYTSFTGVEASLINNNPNSGIVFSSKDYGTDSFVSVRRVGDNQLPLYRFTDSAAMAVGAPFDWAGLVGSGTLVSSNRDTGRDVRALINGNLATGRGLKASLNTPAINVDITLASTFATDPTQAATSFYITGGGALYQIGSEVSALQQTTLGISSVAASRLGATEIDGGLQFLSSLKDGEGNSIRDALARGQDFTPAQDIVSNAIDQVTVLRGRLGSIQLNVFDPSVRSLQAQFENLSASESQIRDADFAFETSRLTRAQILTSAGTSVLSLANQQAQQVLQLLG